MPDQTATTTLGRAAARTVLITGATGGIGSEIGRAFADAGCSVLLHHHGEVEAAERLAGELAELGAKSVGVVEADVADERAVAEMGVAADELAPAGVDVLVNAAGIMFERKVDDFTPADWRRIIDVNLTGTYLVTATVLAGMRKRGSGVIVNVSSQLAFKGASGLTAYAASKGGVVGFTRALAREVGPQIRVYGIAPGPIATPMIEPYADAQWVAERSAGLITGRLGKPDEVAAVCVFLADDRAQLLQGQFLHCNGGGYLA